MDGDRWSRLWSHAWTEGPAPSDADVFGPSLVPDWGNPHWSAPPRDEDAPHRAPVSLALADLRPSFCGESLPDLETIWKNVRNNPRRVARPNRREAAEIESLADRLQDLLLDLGHYDAFHVVGHLVAAVDNCDASLPLRLHDAVEPRTAAGRPPSTISRDVKNVAELVDALREVKPDEHILNYLLRYFVRLLGVPPHARSARPDDFFAEVAGNADLVGQLNLLLQTRADGMAIVRGVHRLLGYPGTNNLTNAATKSASRKAVKKRAARER